MIAWHYTIGRYYRAIVEGGFIMPADIGVIPPEKPIAWFSTQPYWEPTANKAWRDGNGGIRTLTMRETAEHGDGLVRFGVDTSRLLNGETLRRSAHMTKIIWASLKATGKHQHANPSQWYGSIGAVPVDGLVVEVMDIASWKWMPFDGQKAA